MVVSERSPRNNEMTVTEVYLEHEFLSPGEGSRTCVLLLLSSDPTTEGMFHFPLEGTPILSGNSRGLALVNRVPCVVAETKHPHCP